MQALSCLTWWSSKQVILERKGFNNCEGASIFDLCKLRSWCLSIFSCHHQLASGYLSPSIIHGPLVPRCPQNNHNYKSQTTSNPAIITLALMNCLDPRQGRHHQMSPRLMSPGRHWSQTGRWQMRWDHFSLVSCRHGDSLTCKQLCLPQMCGHNKSRNPLILNLETKKLGDWVIPEIWRIVFPSS